MDIIIGGMLGRGVSQLLCSGRASKVSTVRKCACLKEQEGQSAGEGGARLRFLPHMPESLMNIPSMTCSH
jgi:hypothetical protein